MKRSEIFFGVLRLPIDALAVVAAFFLARWLRLVGGPVLDRFQMPAEYIPSISELLPFALGAAGALVALFAANGLYRLRSPIGHGEELKKILTLVSVWVVILISFLFITREFFFSRLALGYIWILAMAFVYAGRVATRLLQAWWMRVTGTVRRVAIVGLNADARAICDELTRDTTYDIIGYITTRPTRGKTDAKIIGSMAYFESILDTQSIDEVIIVREDLPQDALRDMLTGCRERHVDFYIVPDLLALSQERADLTTVAGLPVVRLRLTPLEGWGRVVKRAFDITIGTLAIIGTSPIWLATAIAIKLDSPGPIFFSRYPNGKKVLRVGRKGELFHFVKFRSMVVNDHLSRYKMKSHRAGPLVKITHDPRITRVGEIIRKYSIDELPNLLAVIKGDMSLVGPRAHLPEEVEKYAPHHRRVLTIKPGITGLPQVSGRSDLDFEKEIELDTWYIENWSVWLDIKILWKTIAVVLFPSHRE